MLFPGLMTSKKSRIHKCEGPELDYIGVIVGPDLIVKNVIMMVDPSERSHMDRSIHGYNALLQNNAEEY